LRRVAAALALVAAIVVAAAAIRLASVPSPRTMRFDVPRRAVAVPADAAAIERGRHLSEAVAVCTVCHGDDLGGRLAFEHPLLGRGYTPNLTRGRGGIGASYQAADWERALRHGVDRSGRGLLFMPVDHYRHLSDADLGAIIAYARSLPPVDNERTGLELTWLARTMIDLGLSGPVVRAAQIDHSAPPPAPPQDVGAYLVEIGGCTFCHGAALTGGRGLEPGAPPGPALTRGSRIAAAGFDRFAAALRAGRAADGHAIDPKFMPWQGYRRMTDAELRSIWAHLQRLPDDARGAAAGPYHGQPTKEP
jgi:mono/diheme cytochrome c family protein